MLPITIRLFVLHKVRQAGSVPVVRKVGMTGSEVTGQDAKVCSVRTTSHRSDIKQCVFRNSELLFYFSSAGHRTSFAGLGSHSGDWSNFAVSRCGGRSRVSRGVTGVRADTGGTRLNNTRRRVFYFCIYLWLI